MKATLLILIALVWTQGCSQETNSNAQTSAAMLDQPWPKIEQIARGTTVNLFMWGGDDGYNNYIDDYATPKLKRRFDVILKRIPLSGADITLNKLLAEKQAGSARGTIDLIWINGEGFATGAQADLWLGPWAEQLPNARYIDWRSPAINRDFGFPVKGREAPWSRAQFVMIYNSAEIKKPPKTLPQLLAWAKAHPGRFTYPALPDFTGTAFVEQAFVLLTDHAYQGRFDQQRFAQQVPKLWRYLNALEPYLWRQGETYPASGPKLNELFQSGEVSMTMSYSPQFAQANVNKGLFPKSTRTFVFDGGTLHNTSYLAIPFNAPNKAGAAVVANFLESPNAQIRKQDPDLLGALTVLNLKRLTAPQRKALSRLGGAATLPISVLETHRIPETNYDWVLPLQDGWQDHVARQ